MALKILSNSAASINSPVIPYTPTFTASTTNPTLGNSTFTGYYQIIGHGLMWVSIALTVGSTFSRGSGEYRFGLPSGITANANISKQALTASILDAGTDWKLATGVIDGAGNYIFVIGEGVITISDVSPITWATGDTINITGIIAI